jgi:dsRNA-specific ribonuclease
MSVEIETEPEPIFTEEVSSVETDECQKILRELQQDDCLTIEGGTMIYDPYNTRNKEITLPELQRILTMYGVPGKINNINLYKRAFVHRSYTKHPHLENVAQNIVLEQQPENCLPLKTKSNERLEFLGDGVLECVTKYYLYRRFPKESEGFMTEKKIALVKNEAIGRLAMEMGLNKWFIISQHAEEKNIRGNIKKLGCLFEAFVGALFLDFNKQTIHDEDEWFDTVFMTGPGFQVAQIFIESIFEKHVNWIELIKNNDNYKNILQVKIQKEFKTTPYYKLLNYDLETGYTMGLYLAIGIEEHNIDVNSAIGFEQFGSFDAITEYVSNNKSNSALIYFAESTHRKKKKAEQNACKIAIELIDRQH